MYLNDFRVKRAFEDKRFNQNNFLLSDVNSKFIKKYNLNCTVNEFKEKVRESTPEFITITGNKMIRTKRTKVYNVQDFKK